VKKAEVSLKSLLLKDHPHKEACHQGIYRRSHNEKEVDDDRGEVASQVPRAVCVISHQKRPDNEARTNLLELQGKLVGVVRDALVTVKG